MMDKKTAILFSARTLLVHIGLFYINTYYLLPRLLGKSKYFTYVLSLLAVLVLTSLFFYSTDSVVGFERPKMSEIGARDEFSHERHYMSDSTSKSTNKWDDERYASSFERDSLHMPPPEPGRYSKPPMFPIPPYVRAGALSTIGILFISILFWVIGESRKQREYELALVNQNLRNEMKFLKSQINPHFLFNALNNIYSLSIRNSIKTPDMILKLSAMLRYVLYDSEGKKVPLYKEVDYIKNFIDFQRVKIEGIPNIHVDIERIDGQVMIEPMLLIPFIENAFKYSKIEDTKNGWIKILLSTERGVLKFEIRNSLLIKNVNGDLGGIGIENTRQRLKMLYPDKHELYVGQKEDEFMVLLKIEINEA